jgi:hypothetical protein
MELDHIDKDTESMTTLILKVNQLLDTISIAFNSLEKSESSTVAGATKEEIVQSVLNKMVGKNFKFGTTNEPTVAKNTLFVDRADSKLKFKDKSSIVTPLT